MHSVCPRVPIIVLTGLSDLRVATDALKNGASDYLEKGEIQPRNLFRAIRYAIERKKSETELVRLARTDPLTGLLNRRAFFEQLEAALVQARRSELACAVILFDIDRFKEINDVFGHKTGDDVLIEVDQAVCARSSARPTAIARIGGDEFAVLATNLKSASSAMEIAEKIVKAVSAINELNDMRARNLDQRRHFGLPDGRLQRRRARLPRRPGDVQVEGEQEGLDQLLRRAHGRSRQGAPRAEALDAAATSPTGASTCCSSRSSTPRTPQDHRRRGPRPLARPGGQDHRARRVHPDRRGIRARSAISATASSRRPAARFAAGPTCTRRWCRSRSTSRRSSAAIPAFGARLINDHREAGDIAAASINIEITESTIFKNLDVIQKNLDMIKSYGVGVHIDDFGTGYSSLSLLARPAARCAEDRPQLRARHRQGGRVRDDRPGGRRTRQEARFQTIAEGVETEEQVAMLRDIGVNSLQGYYFSKPVPGAQLAGWLAKSEAYLVA